MPDSDFLKIFHAPEVPILAHCTKIEARDSKCPGADFRVPGVEATEEKIRIAVRQLSGLDRVEVVDQKEKDVTVG